MRSPFQSHCDVTPVSKDFEVTAGTTPKIQNYVWRLTLDARQQGIDVLPNIMIARAFPKRFGMLIIVTQCVMSNFLQISWIEFHFDLAT
jgi:hypothetical protein